jgi:hypothetical protein
MIADLPGSTDRMLAPYLPYRRRSLVSSHDDGSRATVTFVVEGTFSESFNFWIDLKARPPLRGSKI